MLCTDCSEEVKPVVSIDIDGTLGNYHDHFVRFAEDYLAKPLPRNYDGWLEFNEYLGIPKSVYREVKLAYRQGGMKRTMPIYNGAWAFTQSIRKLGCEIWIATTRPYLRLDNIDPDTREWLIRHGIAYDYILYGEDKYQVLSNRVDQGRVLAVFDDQVEQCLAAEKVFGEISVQPERPHNEATRWHSTFAKFDEAYEIVQARIARSAWAS